MRAKWGNGWAVAGWVLAGVGLLAAARPAPLDVVTRRLAIVDSEGRECLQMKAGPDGSPLLVLRTPAGVPAMSLSAGDVPMVSLYDAKGQPRLSISLDNDGAPTLMMPDTPGRRDRFVRLRDLPGVNIDRLPPRD
jgi:hypothetical protein